MSDIFSSQTRHLVFRSPGIGLVDVDVYGNITVHSDETTLREALIVEGNTKLIGRTTSTGPDDNALEVEGDTVITTLGVGKPGLTVHGDTLLDGNLEVNLDTLLHGNLDVDLDTRLHGNLTVDLDTELLGNLTVRGDTIIDGTLLVNSDASVIGNFNVDAHTTLNTLTVEGDSVFDQTVLITGDLTIRGDITIIGDGEQIIENQKSIAVEDPLLYLNFGVWDIALDPESKGMIIDRGLFSIITVNDGTDTVTTVERVSFENGQWFIKLDGSGIPVWRDDPVFSHHGQTLTKAVVDSGTYPAPSPAAVTDPASVVWTELGGENDNGTWRLNWTLQDRTSLSPDGGTTAPGNLPVLTPVDRTLRGLRTPLTSPESDYTVNVEYLTQETDKINDRIDNLTLDDLYDVEATGPLQDWVIYYDVPTVEWVAREFEIRRDTSPQLGQNLDVVTHSIVSVGAGTPIKLAPSYDVSTSFIQLNGVTGTETITTSGSTELVISPSTNLKLNAVYWPKNTGAVDQILALNNANTLVWKNTVHSVTAGEGLSSELSKTTGDLVIHVNVGTGLSITSDVIVHNTVPQQLDTNNIDGTVLQNLTFDTNRLGHVIGLTSVNLDGRYTPTVDADVKYVLKDGDTMRGDLTAPNFIGHLQGNADTSTNWAAPITITLGEDLTGNVSIDGSGNVTLNATVVDNSHGHEIDDVEGLPEILDEIMSTPSAVYVGETPPAEAVPNTLWYDSVGGMLYIYYQDVDSIQWVEASPQGTPEDILGADLATDEGAGMIGTESGLTVQEELDNKVPMTRRINGYDLTVDRNLTATDVGALPSGGTAVAAQKLINKRNIILSGDATGSVGFDGVADATLAVTITDDSHAHIIANVDGLQAALDGKLSTTGVAASATKLATARTISLTGDVTGSVSFDGTANAAIAATIAAGSHTHPISDITSLQSSLDGKVDLAGDTMTGNLTTPKVIMSAAQGTGGGDAVRYDYLNSQTPIRGTDLGAGQDLNNYQTAGFYYQDSDADAASGANYPLAKSGSLLVLKSAGITQVYIAYGTNYACYTRGFYGGTWSNWSRFYTTNFKPTAADVGAIPLSGGAASGRIVAIGNGNDYSGGGLETQGNGSANTVKPVLSFHQPGLYASSLQLAASGDFRFYNQGLGSYAALTVGSLYSVGNGDFNDVQIRSDARLKSNIVTIDSALDKVNQLTGCTYDKKLDLSSTETKREAGLIAQHLQKVLPEAVATSGEDELLTISSASVNALLVEAIKELAAEVKELKAKLAKLGVQ